MQVLISVDGCSLQEEQQEWASLYQQLDKRDAATIADWKDELNNIAIFVRSCPAASSL